MNQDQIKTTLKKVVTLYLYVRDVFESAGTQLLGLVDLRDSKYNSD